MKKTILLLALTYCSLFSLAQAPEHYYDGASGKTGEELRSALHDIIKDHTTISYSQIWNAFWSTDNKGNGVVWDMYSDIPNETPPYIYQMGQNQCGEYSQEGNCYNREHSWPQSWFNNASTPTTDLHHIFPTDGFVNATRSNYPYGEVNTVSWTSQNGSKLGTCKSSLGYSGTVFEPIDEYKGDFARAIMYMSVRYYGEDSNWGSSDMTNKSVIKDWAIAMLLDWSDNDPVSQKEIERNNVIYSDYQNNRNPFIDHPEYARAIWDPNWTNTEHNIHYNTVQHGSISGPATAVEGTMVTLTATPATGYSLYSWYVYKTGDINTMVYQGTGNTFTMPAFNVTVTASFVLGSVGDNYVKVTSAPTDWSGDYLIVYETGSKAFDGRLTTLDATSNTIAVTINNSSIASTAKIDSSNFTIAKSGGNYTIQSASGYYIGQTSNANGLSANETTAYTNTISYNSESSINIVGSGGAYLRYNATSGQERFRYFKSSTYSAQQPIQLYKKTAGTTSVPTHTIYFMSNGGIGTMNNQTVNEYEPKQLDANAFSRSGYEFMGWNTQADGSGQYYTDGATVTLLDDLTLYAQWKQIFTITLASVEHGSVTVSQNQAIEGDLITLTATPASEYEFYHWNVTDASNQPITVVDDKFEMPASDVTVDASFVYVGLPFVQQYHLVTSTDQLVAGRTYLIVNTAAAKALGNTQNTNNRSGVGVTIGSGVISSIATSVCELTLGGSMGAWTFFDANWGENGGYLYAASSTANQLKTQATNNGNGQWRISIADNGTATVVAQGNNTRNNLRYNPNSGNPIFSCYDSTSNMAKVELYIRSEEFDHTESGTVNNLYAFDKHVVGSGTILSVSGTATCDDPSHLIIEEGGQFIHHNSGVQATFKKSVDAYTTDGGWYTIATPFNSYDPANTTMVSDNYDLYQFDETNPKEWRNYKANPFNLETGRGYLYAHHPGITQRMTGTLNQGDSTKTVNLSYGNEEETIRGFNLLGNPTAHNITFNKTENVSDGYYYLSNSETWVYEPSNSVPTGRGFLVKANADSQSVTLNPQDKSQRDDKAPFISIDIDGELAYVKMTEGVSMPLFRFRDKSSSLWLNHNGKPYIMLVREDANAIELNYQPRRQGQHTLNIAAQEQNLDYLHLLDRLTGVDIDLLTMPTYSFESHNNDYAGRFQLVFTPNDSSSNAPFAFINNGNIVVYGTYNEATLQIIDVTGRILVSQHGATSMIPTAGMASGMYLIKLITPEKTQTQKIIINN